MLAMTNSNLCEDICRRLALPAPQELQDAVDVWQFNMDSCAGCPIISQIILNPATPELGEPDEDDWFHVEFTSSCFEWEEGPHSITMVYRADIRKVVITAIEGTPNPWGIKTPTFPSRLYNPKNGLGLTKDLINQPLHPGDSTSSKSTLDLASLWLSACLKYHSDTCAREENTGPLYPNLMVDIGDEDATKVVLRNTIDRKARYMCLSYCWGKADFIRSTTSNIDAHMSNGIDLMSLPQVFRDFILVAKKFLVRYVWIDALCILQDSQEDWQCEAAKMAQIYQNSFLTVAAAGASNPHEGMFATRSSFIAGTVQCHILEHGCTSWKFPLLSRAWAYQERLLSPRVLFFGPSEIQWECRDCCTCECGVPIDRVDLFNVSSGSDVLTRQYVWRGLVRDYSRLLLTKESDRLPALAGLVNYMGRTGKSCLAGLWQECLILDMLWYCARPAKARVADDNESIYSVPSWSWMSILGGVDYESYMCAPYYQEAEKTIVHCDVLDAECVLTGHPQTGQVKSGQVRLRGHMIGGRLVETDIWMKNSGSLYRRSRGIELEVQDRKTDVNIDTWNDNVGDSDVWLLRVASNPWTDILLVLKKLEVSEDIYRRIGLYGPQQWLYKPMERRYQKDRFFEWSGEMKEITIV